jgi:hypothetical protein
MKTFEQAAKDMVKIPSGLSNPTIDKFQYDAITIYVKGVNDFKERALQSIADQINSVHPATQQQQEIKEHLKITLHNIKNLIYENIQSN